MQIWVAESLKRGLRFLVEEREAVQELYWRPIGTTVGSLFSASRKMKGITSRVRNWKHYEH